MKVSKIVSAGTLFFAFMFLCSSLAPEKVYANDLILLGDAKGLEIYSDNPENPLAMLFSVNKMTPGDSVSSTITVKNSYEYAFTLSVEVKDLHDNDDGLNLSDEFIITIEQDGEELTSFPKRSGTYVFPEKFAPKSKSLLKFTVNLPGEVGNDYQNTSAELQWIFKAERATAPTPSKTPGPPGPSSTPKPTRSPRPTGTSRPPSTPKPSGTPNPSGTPEATSDSSEVLPWSIEIDDTSPPGMSYIELAAKDGEVGAYAMPKTGELPLQIYILGGAMLVIIGFALISGKAGAVHLITAVKNLYKKKEKLE